MFGFFKKKVSPQSSRALGRVANVLTHAVQEVSEAHLGLVQSLMDIYDNYDDGGLWVAGYAASEYFIDTHTGGLANVIRAGVWDVVGDVHSDLAGSEAAFQAKIAEARRTLDEAIRVNFALPQDALSGAQLDCAVRTVARLPGDVVRSGSPARGAMLEEAMTEAASRIKRSVVKA